VNYFVFLSALSLFFYQVLQLIGLCQVESKTLPSDESECRVRKSHRSFLPPLAMLLLRTATHGARHAGERNLDPLLFMDIRRKHPRAARSTARYYCRGNSIFVQHS